MAPRARDLRPVPVVGRPRRPGRPRRRTALGRPVTAALAVAVGLLAACTDPDPSGDASGPPHGAVAPGEVPGPPDAALPDVDPDAVAAALEQSELGSLNPTRLADGLVPPTNRWFSGLVFEPAAEGGTGTGPMPVFPAPLSVGLAGGALTLGVPEPVTSDRAIVAPHEPALSADVGATDIQVTAYDEASVTVALLGDDGAQGTVVLAQGSPFVPFTASRDVDVAVAGELTEVAAPDGFAAASAELAGRTWMVVAPAGALVTGPGEGGPGDDAGGAGSAGTGSVRLAEGETATWFPLPDDASQGTADELVAAATHPVTGTTLAYGVGDGVARTTLGWATADGGATAFVTMPHHRQGEQPDREGCGLGTYPSVYGTLELCAGSQLTSWAPLLEPTGAVDVGELDDTERADVLDALRADVAATPDEPADTYFGGKWLYRAASLVTLGEQLGAGEDVAQLREAAEEVLRRWAEPDGCAERDAFCFGYDPTARGVVGQVPSFGSDEFNDHHFHWGYLLSAAGLLAADDPALAEEVAPVIDALAQDVAAIVPNESFPTLRGFDAYAGHSWASGTSPFADGNNQESSSEAVNAWNGLGLWAQARGDAETGALASWLMSTEASAITYWTDLDLSDPVYEGYGHEVVTLNWGAKRDWATWFSAEPSAMLGILLIPMGPFADYLGRAEPERIRAAVQEAAPGGFDVQFGDYLLMYLALAGEQDAAQAWQEAVALPQDVIDDGSSRAAMLAWIGSRT